MSSRRRLAGTSKSRTCRPETGLVRAPSVTARQAQHSAPLLIDRCDTLRRAAFRANRVSWRAAVELRRHTDAGLGPRGRRLRVCHKPTEAEVSCGIGAALDLLRVSLVRGSRSERAAWVTRPAAGSRHLRFRASRCPRRLCAGLTCASFGGYGPSQSMWGTMGPDPADVDTGMPLAGTGVGGRFSWGQLLQRGAAALGGSAGLRAPRPEFEVKSTPAHRVPDTGETACPALAIGP